MRRMESPEKEGFKVKDDSISDTKFGKEDLKVVEHSLLKLEPKAEVADGRAELLRLLGEDGMKGTVTTCR